MRTLLKLPLLTGTPPFVRPWDTKTVNFFTGLSVVNGATPAKLFQISTVRLRGQEATSLTSSWGQPKYSAL